MVESTRARRGVQLVRGSHCGVGVWCGGGVGGVGEHTRLHVWGEVPHVCGGHPRPHTPQQETALVLTHQLVPHKRWGFVCLFVCLCFLEKWRYVCRLCGVLFR